MRNERRRRRDGVRCVRKKTRKRRGGFVDTMRCVDRSIERERGTRAGRYPKSLKVWFSRFAGSVVGRSRCFGPTVCEI